jgi:hypothetical protein
MSSIEWKEFENEGVVQSFIKEFGIVYWITKKRIEDLEYEDYSYDLYFSNDAYNLSNQITLQSNTDLKTAMDVAKYHLDKILSMY